MRVIRIKCISQCMGIRRTSLVYLYGDKESCDLTLFEHPIKEFKQVVLMNNQLKIGNEMVPFELNNTQNYIISRKVSSITGSETETICFQTLSFELTKQMKSSYEKALEYGEWFDEYKGEYEFLLAILYKFEFKDEVLYHSYIEKSCHEGFKYALYEVGGLK